MAAYSTALACLTFSVCINEVVHTAYKFGAVAIEREYIGKRGGEAVKDRYLSTAAFIHHRHTHSVAESCFPVHKNRVDVFYAGVIANVVVGNIVMDIIQMTIIAYGAVVNHRVPYTRMYFHPARERDRAAEKPKPYLAGKACMVYVFRLKAVFDEYGLPVCCGAALRRELLSLAVCKWSVCHLRK